jgi:hypothetical protein
MASHFSRFGEKPPNEGISKCRMQCSELQDVQHLPWENHEISQSTWQSFENIFQKVSFNRKIVHMQALAQQEDDLSRRK